MNRAGCSYRPLGLVRLDEFATMSDVNTTVRRAAQQRDELALGTAGKREMIPPNVEKIYLVVFPLSPC